MSWQIKWEELDGEELRKEKKKNQKRARKSDVYNQAEQTEALLRSNSRSSIGSDKVGSAGEVALFVETTKFCFMFCFLSSRFLSFVK